VLRNQRSSRSGNGDQVRPERAIGSIRNTHVLDANRTAQAWDASAQQEAAILRLRPLLSRVDTIVEIPRDDQRAWRVSESIYGTLGGRAGALEDQPWVRRCRLLVAAMRDNYPHVALDSVQGKMIQVHQFIRDRGGIPDSGDFAARLAVTFTRLVVASARSDGRQVACEDDLQRAIKYMGHKVRYLRQHHVSLRDVPAMDPIDAFVAGHAGQEVRPVDLRAKYEEKTGDRVDERTMRRHIRAWPHRKRGKGTYLLLTPGAQ
jgi:hypothetical protein